ncbi:hypothetical protein PSTT_02752, partial [Puccinia striiformis]
MASPAKFTPPTPAEIQKVLDTCHRLNSTPAKLTPKRFFEIFMTTGNSEVAYLRRYWRTARGLASNLRLLPHLRDDILQADGGQDAWASFIQQEASTFCTLALVAVKILVSQEAPRGNYPLGSFHSSLSVGRTFFSHEEQRLQDTTMTTTHMPFLYGMINDVLNQRGPLNDQSEDDGVLKASNVPTTKHVEDPEPEEIGEVAYVQSLTGKDRTMARFDRILGNTCPGRDTRSASRSRSDFLNIDHQRFADPSTTVRSTKQVDLDPIPEINHPIERVVMNNNDEILGDERVTLSTERWNAEMYKSLKIDAGASIIHQSHNNHLSTKSLTMFMQMANNRDLLALNTPPKPEVHIKRDNTYLSGFGKMKKTIRTTDPELKKFKKHLFLQKQGHVNRGADEKTVKMMKLAR